MRKQIYFLLAYSLFKIVYAEAHFYVKRPLLDIIILGNLLGTFILTWYWNKLLSSVDGSPKWHWGWLSLLNIYSVILHYIAIVSIKRKKTTD